MKSKKTIVPILSVLTFVTVLTACGATAASDLTLHLAKSGVPPAQVMSANNAVAPTSNSNGKENDVVPDVLSGGEGSDPIEFWGISEYENWMKTEHEKNQKLADSGDVSFYAKDASDNYVCRAWTQADVNLLYAEWQKQLSLMKQGYHFTKTITLPNGGLLVGAFEPETWNAKPSVAPGSTIITMPDKSTVDLGHFDTSDEAVKAVSVFLKKQVEQGNLTQKQADAILANGTFE